MKPHPINNLNNFIAGWTIDDSQLFNDLIEYFENSENQVEGRFGMGVVDATAKKSTDLSVSQYIEDLNTPCKKYVKELIKVLDEYKKIYVYCEKEKETWGMREPFNLQRYLPNEGFFQWHCERGGLAKADRHLVFMTYLNDVIDGGETEWYYQNIKIKPERGLTVIWPSDWTFTHRGNTSPTQTKYIATGWFNFFG